MKKIFIINALLILIPLLLIQPLRAAILTDVSGAYIDLGDEGSVSGAGIAFLWDMPRYFDNESVFFYINSTFAYRVENRNEPAEAVYSYIPVTAGFEYRYQVLDIPLYITGSAGAGVSYFKKEGPVYSGPFMDPSRTQIDTAFGPFTNLMLGLNYVLSQNAAFFAQGGYQVSFYHEDRIESPAGFQFVIGLRIPISGSLRGFD